jgi:glucose-6-phosphate isomerase
MNPCYRLDQWEHYKDLQQEAVRMTQADRHLKHLIAAENRLEAFSVYGGGLFFDYSRQRVDQSILNLLLEAAAVIDLPGKFQAMCSGSKINLTEQRAVLHTATRYFGSDPILVDGCDVMPEIIQVREAIRTFSTRVLRGEIRGAGDKPFRDIVIVGIGGSYLGTEFAATALAAFADKNIRLHFLANVDIHNFGAVAAAVDPAATLWIIISKSYTTAETMANARQAEHFMRGHGLDPAGHIVTVTSKGSPGDDPANPVLASFHMFDYIGGRYSVTSAVGGVPLSLYLGYDRFEEFLHGANDMDNHALTTPAQKNLPLLAALISVWNTTFLGYQQQAVIPYATPLAKLAPHVQQLNMESNGKSADIRGELLHTPAGTVIFGEPGTNAQHSFFQLAHQGRPFPIDFIGVLKPQYTQYTAVSKGVDNHQELWANMLAQATALAIGRESKDKTRHFSGNRPSSTLVLEDLSPRNVGRLLAFYEARTVFEGFLWGINSFDQFGVQLGKTVASNLRLQMSARNNDEVSSFKDVESIPRAYLEMLFRGKIKA